MQPGEYHPRPSVFSIKLMDQTRKTIDELLQKRMQGYYDFVRSTEELVDLGVKIGQGENLELPKSFQKYLDQYEISNLEFEWEVEYTDGTTLKQFQGGQEHNFKHIDLSKLKSVAYISNFDWPTDMKETRIIVRLNWQTGLFEFMNGFAPQDVRAVCCMNPLPGDKKLIMFARKNNSGVAGQVTADSALSSMMGQYFIYNRFVLGYEVDGNKKAVMIYPNGEMRLFND